MLAGRSVYVVEARDYGTADGDPREAMEYFPLDTLSTLLRGSMVGGAGLAREFVTETVDTLEHLHGLDINDRDPQASKHLCVQAGPVDLVIGDLGISIRGAGTVAARMRGMWASAAPEAGSPLVKERADRWSIGMMAHELLTGRHPLADADGLLPSDNQVRASVFNGAVDAAAVDHPCPISSICIYAGDSNATILRDRPLHGLGSRFGSPNCKQRLNPTLRSTPRSGR